MMWMLSLNVNQSSDNSSKVYSTTWSTMLTKREKGSITLYDSTMNGKRKKEKHGAADNWKMKTIRSVFSAAKFSFKSEEPQDDSFSHNK